MRVSGGTSPIKKTLLYKERDENLRREFQEKISCIAKNRLVFLDESGIDTFVSRHFRRAQKGEKIQGEISGRRYARKSFIAAKVGSTIIAPMIFEGTCNSNLFETWVEKVLVQELIPGQLIIMDNALYRESVSRGNNLIQGLKKEAQRAAREEAQAWEAAQEFCQTEYDQVALRYKAYWQQQQQKIETFISNAKKRLQLLS